MHGDASHCVAGLAWSRSIWRERDLVLRNRWVFYSGIVIVALICEPEAKKIPQICTSMSAWAAIALNPEPFRANHLTAANSWEFSLRLTFLDPWVGCLEDGSLGALLSRSKPISFCLSQIVRRNSLPHWLDLNVFAMSRIAVDLSKNKGVCDTYFNKIWGRKALIFLFQENKCQVQTSAGHPIYFWDSPYWTTSMIDRLLIQGCIV